jgi:SAM-dependent methyltransferase
LDLTFVDLGSAPPSNAYLTDETLRAPERWFPLEVMVCTGCWLVQTLDYAHREVLFSSDYAYFSSISSSWVRHAENYVEMVTQRLRLDGRSQVIEVASNDGYLLQFVKSRGIPCVGIEPTASTAQAARDKGIDVIEGFFGGELARRMVQDGIKADLIIANNVLAHVPHINDFVSAIATLLKGSGVATIEFPHLLALVRDNQFDTIYHEHFSYLSFAAARRILKHGGLTAFDVEELPTHGGSLRVYVQRTDTGTRGLHDSVGEMLAKERVAGIESEFFYRGFQERANQVKNEFLAFLLKARKDGKLVAAYGAAAKGNTLMNYAGIRPDLVRFVVDRSPAKQGKFMPGSRIPIVDELHLQAARPDFIVILPWNLKEELCRQLASVREWGGKLVTVIPGLEII